MRTLSLSEAKMKLSSLVDEIHDRDEEFVITRKGRPAAVLVSPQEFESWKETEAVRADANLMAEVRKGLAALKRRGGKLYTLDELFLGRS
ncbi:MAG: type II toxin-antitoxin system Phd/YefM family antitoxin [Acidobacteriota bacterium]